MVKAILGITLFLTGGTMLIPPPQHATNIVRECVFAPPTRAESGKITVMSGTFFIEQRSTMPALLAPPKSLAR